jgi:hypothetical protein
MATKTIKQKQIERDHRILTRFTEVYCRKHHGGRKGAVCNECAGLLEYGRKRLEKCPHDPKPKCKKCPTHCYKPKYRKLVKEIMKYSGMHFVKRGRIDWVFRYFFS